MKKLIPLLTVILSLYTSSLSLAYYQNWSPYEFKQTPYKHLDIKPLDEKQVPSLIKENSDMSQFSEVYQTDIDGNGLEDYIVLHEEPSPLTNKVDIFLQMKKSIYGKIFYGSCAVGLEDFVDINKDGHYEIIISSLYEGKKHNYMAYSIYQIKGCRLVNADKKFKGFPRFVWMTDKPNDQDTGYLTSQERQRHIARQNASIKYNSIP